MATGAALIDAVAQVIRPGAFSLPPRLGLVRARRTAVGVRRIRDCCCLNVAHASANTAVSTIRS